MTKNISILGSTGSIGVQTLDVARNLNMKVLGLTAHSNIELLSEQIKEFKPKYASIGDESLVDSLKSKISGIDCEIFYGVEGEKKVASISEVDTVVAAIVGIAGLVPTVEAIRNGKNIALANKETLVAAGELVIGEAKKNNVNILPVDSEHSAIFQSLVGNNPKDISKILLTASGGPFRGKNKNELLNVTKAQALNHPNWSMGSKITIDSATLMNKGLEVIEARWLFEIAIDKIEVVVHPQSVIHSMVEYVDGSVIAQLGSPDMRIPIQYALTYPARAKSSFSKVNFFEIGKLTFEKPDMEAFPCLGYAFQAMESGGTMPVVLNAANEVAVNMFLNDRIGFMDIPMIIKKVMDLHKLNKAPTLDDILLADKWAREQVKSLLEI